MEHPALDASTNKKLQALGAVLVYQFGSTFTNFAHKESDADVGVVFAKRARNADETYARTNAFVALLQPFFPSRELDIADLNDCSPLLRQVVASQGYLFFKKSEEDRMRFEMRALDEYEDTRKLRRLRAAAFREKLRVL